MGRTRRRAGDAWNRLGRLPKSAIPWDRRPRLRRVQLHGKVRKLGGCLIAAACLGACGSAQPATKVTRRPAPAPSKACDAGPANPQFCQGLTFLGGSEPTASTANGNCGGLRATSKTDAIASISAVGVDCRAARTLTVASVLRCSESSGDTCQVPPWSCKTATVHLGLALKGECTDAKRRVTWVTSNAA